MIILSNDGTKWFESSFLYSFRRKIVRCDKIDFFISNRIYMIIALDTRTKHSPNFEYYEIIK